MSDADVCVELLAITVTFLHLSQQVQICHFKHARRQLSLTSHADVNWVQSCCKHFDYNLIGVVDDGETGIFSEP